MLSQHLNKTLKMLALCTGLISTSHFAQANDFATHPDYLNFKQKLFKQVVKSKYTCYTNSINIKEIKNA